MSGDKKGPSLTEFAEARPKKSRPAWIDGIPPEVRAEAKAGYEAGVGYQVIVEWLRAQGYDATMNRIRGRLE